MGNPVPVEPRGPWRSSGLSTEELGKVFLQPREQGAGWHQAADGVRSPSWDRCEGHNLGSPPRFPLHGDLWIQEQPRVPALHRGGCFHPASASLLLKQARSRPRAVGRAAAAIKVVKCHQHHYGLGTRS